jgi:hypothetical protein
MKMLNKQSLSQVNGGILIYPNGHELAVSTSYVPGKDFIQIEYLIQSLLFNQIPLQEYKNQLESISYSSVNAYMLNFKDACEQLL